MQTIIKYTVLIILALSTSNVWSQDTIQTYQDKYEKSIELLKAKIKTGEKAALKIEVDRINERVANKELTYEEGEDLKQEMAKKRALNIKNREEILVSKMAFYKRNDLPIPHLKEDNNGQFEIYIGDSRDKFTIATQLQHPVKYDIRTTNDFLFAVGYNNAIVDGKSLSDSPYSIGQSGFMELGWNWKTRLGESGNAPRLKYGFSFQWNRYEVDDNKYFVQNGNTTTLETFSENLKLAELRMTNLTFPVYFEFGKMRKIEKPDRVRYITGRKFKFGLGGYAGVRLGTQQKLKYKKDGDRVKEKIKRNYNTNPFVYGVGAYVGFGHYSLYAKYDLSKTFKNDAIKQNNISLGIRMDLD